MKSELHNIEAGDRLIAFELKRSSRRTLGISVLPTGDVVVTAPHAADLTAILGKLQKRVGWILNRQSETTERPVPTGARRFVPGESHLFLGRQYRLRVDPDTLGVRREGNRIVVGGVQPDEANRIRNRLNRWYARQARSIFSERLEACLNLFRHENLPRPKLKVMPLEKRWGSYVESTHSLVLNRHLVGMSVPMIDYVIVHELCHVQNPSHGPQFISLLSSKMPDWRKRRDALNKFA